MREELKTLCEAVLFDEPMSRHTTIRIGGAADALLYPGNIEEVTHLLGFARRHRLPVLFLGAGSNLLVRDKGVRGLVVSLSRGFGKIRLEPSRLLYAEAGVGMPRLAEFAAEQGLSGVESLSGIPGTLGGALVMNAGTREGEIGAVVHSVTFVDSRERVQTWMRERIRFGYRESHFPKGAVLLSARLELKPSTPEAVREKVRSDRARRVETQPLGLPNLGSVFKNPPKGFAARAIEEAGLKGVRVGGARVSEKHANFIVNEGEASARDVLALIGLVRDKVKERLAVGLETEVKVVGEE